MNLERRLDHALGVRALAENLRRAHQARLLAESRRPQEGTYYWLPLPDGTWELASWYVADLGENGVGHVRVWRDSVSHYLAELWGLDQRALARLPYSVPRGRVSRGVGGYWINHGDDAPVAPERLVPEVCREFGLSGILRAHPGKVRAQFDDHELMQRPDRAGLAALLAGARRSA